MSVAKALTDRCPYSDPESLNIWLNEAFQLSMHVWARSHRFLTGAGLRLPKFKLIFLVPRDYRIGAPWKMPGADATCSNHSR
ncbi:hypothetical protein PAPYR_9037 [Paratrimastix pyriformis]|uniref:Uncharacterized protein n=1 Tax=Paratrimastix pyriformis TaxID=342808 RepID=A0ABQ8U9D4_9EUKA|nr:hypothetical protein PAPYR_9037 [Paratrimastix pyriformis]